MSFSILDKKMNGNQLSYFYHTHAYSSTKANNIIYWTYVCIKAHSFIAVCFGMIKLTFMHLTKHFVLHGLKNNIMLSSSITKTNWKKQQETSMDCFTIFKLLPMRNIFLWSCDKVYHKQEVCFLLYFLGQTVNNIILIYWIKIDHVLL